MARRLVVACSPTERVVVPIMAAITILTATDLAKSFGPDQIFHDVSFQIADREHVALVGVNGAGKSTLLHILAGIEAPSAGEVAVARAARVTFLPQEARFESDRTIRAEAQLAFAEALHAAERMRRLEHEMQSASGTDLDELFQEYERLSLHFEASGGYDVEHRTEEILSGLGFDLAQLDEPVDALSGGQKTRVALAKALLADPDLLLLDEPTNHLDLQMLEWLESFLGSWGGACIIVSHDRYFLDRVTTRTLDLSFGRLEDYPAPYVRFLVLREERRGRHRQEYEEQQALIARTEEFIRRYKAGQRSREARGRQTKLDRLERIERPQEYAALKLRSGPVVRSGRMVVETTPLQVGYAADGETRVLVSTPELKVERGDRVAIMGPNGSGKSTLLKTLVGELPPLRGQVSFGTNVKLGYYAQAHEGLPREGTPLSLLLDTQSFGEEAARNYLGRFLFSSDEVLRPIAALSGGERSRLALAALLVQGANLLILDEPTNHLDIQARETLEEMLVELRGDGHLRLARPLLRRSRRQPNLAHRRWRAGAVPGELHRRPPAADAPDRGLSPRQAGSGAAAACCRRAGRSPLADIQQRLAPQKAPDRGGDGHWPPGRAAQRAERRHHHR